MNFIDNFLLNSMAILFPILLYMFYLAYNKKVQKEENELFLGLSLFLSMYFLIKIGNNFLVIDIPIIIAYIRKRKIEAIFLSLIALLYYYNLNFDLLWLFIEYICCFILSLFCNKNNYAFGSIVMLFKIKNNIFLFISSYLVMIFAIFMLKKGEDIIKYHMTYKELEKEKQIRLSLFKITHEIKNPLAVCKGYLDMLDLKDKNKSEKYVPIIKEEIDRTLLLLQDFLSMNKIKLDMDILDINFLIEETIDNLKGLMKEKNVNISFNNNDEIYINGDYNRLKQVIINILKNSVEGDSTLIEIDSKINNHYVILNFKDNGCGISKENLSRIKEPFFTTKLKGSGLGVSLSYEIIGAHNGLISYESEEDIGTLVKIKIPLMD